MSQEIKDRQDQENAESKVGDEISNHKASEEMKKRWIEYAKGEIYRETLLKQSLTNWSPRKVRAWEEGFLTQWIEANKELLELTPEDLSDLKGPSAMKMIETQIKKIQSSNWVHQPNLRRMVDEKPTLLGIEEEKIAKKLVEGIEAIWHELEEAKDRNQVGLWIVNLLRAKMMSKEKGQEDESLRNWLIQKAKAREVALQCSAGGMVERAIAMDNVKELEFWWNTTRDVMVERGEPFLGMWSISRKLREGNLLKGMSHPEAWAALYGASECWRWLKREAGHEARMNESISSGNWWILNVKENRSGRRWLDLEDLKRLQSYGVKLENLEDKERGNWLEGMLNLKRSGAINEKTIDWVIRKVTSWSRPKDGVVRWIDELKEHPDWNVEGQMGAMVEKKALKISEYETWILKNALKESRKGEENGTETKNKLKKGAVSSPKRL